MPSNLKDADHCSWCFITSSFIIINNTRKREGETVCSKIILDLSSNFFGSMIPRSSPSLLVNILGTFVFPFSFFILTCRTTALGFRSLVRCFKVYGLPPLDRFLNAASNGTSSNRDTEATLEFGITELKIENRIVLLLFSPEKLTACRIFTVVSRRPEFPL